MTLPAPVGAVDLRSLSGPAQSLILPLLIRAEECRRPDALVRDLLAVQLLDRVKFEAGRFRMHQLDRVCVLLRLREFDRRARAFLTAHLGAVVVHLGCGLDTRFERVDDGHVIWYDLDLPEVIALRQQVLRPNRRVRQLAASAADPAWLEVVGGAHAGPVLVLAEGVLPYLSEGEVRRLVGAIAARSPGTELVFDAVSPFLIRLHNLQFALAGIPVRGRWGLTDSRDLERWYPGVRLLAEWYYFDQPEPRLGWARWLRRVPLIGRGARILHYRLGSLPGSRD